MRPPTDLQFADVERIAIVGCPPGALRLGGDSIRCGINAELRVVARAGGGALEGVEVLIENPLPPPGAYTRRTDSAGAYLQRVNALRQPAGGYTVTFSKPGGYAPVTVTGVEVPEGVTVIVDAVLDAGRLALPDGVSTGLVYGETGVLSFPIGNLGTRDAAVGVRLLAEFGEDFEGAFPPPGWSVTNAEGDCAWRRNDQISPVSAPVDPVHGGRPNLAGGDGYSAAADADACGFGTVTDTYLTTTPFDLSYAAGARVEFIASYRHRSDSLFALEIGTGGGQQWHAGANWNSDLDPHGPGSPVGVDLDDYAGQAGVRLRWRYLSGWDWWAQIDRVRVITAPAWAGVAGGVTVPAGTTASVEVLLDTAMLPGPGTYILHAVIDHDTPDDIGPVTLTVRVWDDEQLFSDRFERDG